VIPAFFKVATICSEVERDMEKDEELVPLVYHKTLTKKKGSLFFNGEKGKEEKRRRKKYL
jgi:hypothetical protein